MSHIASPNERNSLARFLVVGVLLGLVSSIAMISLESAANTTSRFAHGAVVALVYISAMNGNFFIQRAWVFRSRRSVRFSSIAAFWMVSLFTSFLAGVIAFLLVGWSVFIETFGALADVSSLFIAAVACAPVSYLLTKKAVFLHG